MSRFFLYLFAFLCAIPVFSQTSFTNKIDLLPGSLPHSGVAISVLDMNGDGLDDIAFMDEGFDLTIAYQIGTNLAFQRMNVGAMANESQWGMCAGDLDNNGFNDVLSGGFYNGISLAMANATGTAYTQSNIADPTTFVQGVNFFDINNDGFLDAFVCHDDGVARIFGNDGTGNLIYRPNWIDLTTVPASDNSGNYGTVWSDVNNDGHADLYIAKCRQGVNSPSDGRRINQLFLSNGDGTYTQDLTNASGLRIGAQSWTADFGDIDNDGDMDCFITNHDVSSQLLENDGTGVFTDITDTADLLNAVTNEPIQGLFRDFDNDGFMDIVVTGGSQHIFHNNGDKTFTELTSVFGSNIMESMAIGDLNHDGFPDIYGGYANIYTNPSNIPDAIWMNDGNDNHFFGVSLRGVQSNKNGIGARITLHSPQGIQIREIRSGESYGIMNSLQVQFGLGQNTQIDSVSVLWPSGNLDVIKNAVADNYIIVTEGGCITRVLDVAVEGNLVFCPGDSVILHAPTGSAYAWNGGENTADLIVKTSGLYSVQVTDSLGCVSGTQAVEVVVNPALDAAITPLSDTVFCKDQSVTLQASEAMAYMWNTGATTREITVSAGGNYACGLQGMCQIFETPLISVRVLEPQPAVATGGTTWLGGSVTLTAVGDEVHWFDAQNNEVFVGTPFVTPPLNETTTYSAVNYLTEDEPTVFTGMTDHAGTNTSGNQFNGGLIFDAFQAFNLKSVKVYTAIAGERLIELTKADGNLIDSRLVNIAAGTTVIDLNFNVPIGTEMLLSTSSDHNVAVFGTNSPQLRRSDEGIDYPYAVPNVISINTSNFGTDRYYYFYDWEIDFYGVSCPAEAVEVLAVVDPNMVSNQEPLLANNMSIQPNPVADVLTVLFHTPMSENGQIKITDQTGKLVQDVLNVSFLGKNAMELNVSDLSVGVYYLQILDSRGVRVERFVKL